MAFRVRSYSCLRYIGCNHFYQPCAWVRWAESTVSPVHLTLRISVKRFSPVRFGLENYLQHARHGLCNTNAGCCQMLEPRSSLWQNGRFFFQLLHSDPFVKHWNCDVAGYKLCTSRYPNMESFCRRARKRPRCSVRLTTSVRK